MNALNEWIVRQAWYRYLAYGMLVFTGLLFISLPNILTGLFLFVSLVGSVRAYNAKRLLDSRANAIATAHPEAAKSLPSRSRLAEWCPANTVTVAPNGTYSLVPGLTQKELSNTLRYVNQHIQSQERALRQVERVADNANRVSNVNLSRKTAKHFSTQRSLQGIRHSMSDMQRIQAEGAVHKLAADVNRLHNLQNEIEDEIQEFNINSADTAISISPQSTERRFCRSCGTSFNPGDAFCGVCGANLVN